MQAPQMGRAQKAKGDKAMTYQLFGVYAQDYQGHIIDDITVRARCHQQHIWTHSTLVGVTKSGAKRLAQFHAQHKDGLIKLDVPRHPILDGWIIE
jgi:hypothetical protein